MRRISSSSGHMLLSVKSKFWLSIESSHSIMARPITEKSTLICPSINSTVCLLAGSSNCTTCGPLGTCNYDWTFAPLFSAALELTGSFGFVQKLSSSHFLSSLVFKSSVSSIRSQIVPVGSLIIVHIKFFNGTSGFRLDFIFIYGTGICCCWST